MSPDLTKPEPPDGAIFAAEDFSQFWIRDDSHAAAEDFDDWHWFTSDAFYDPISWEVVSSRPKVRVYRQAEVDQMIAEAVKAATR